MKNTYFEIREFYKCDKDLWNNFCLRSDEAWLWHTHESITSKSLWHNHNNLSFYVVDKSNKNKIIAIFPIFFVKRSKIIDYSTLDSLGGAACENNLNKTKHKKLIRFINEYISLLLNNYKVYKCEILLSTLSSSIIERQKVIPNPLGQLINNDKSSFTWIKSLENETFEKVFQSFDSKTKQTIKKNKAVLSFHQVNSSNAKELSDKYYEFHLETTKRKNINPQSKSYYEYIFLKFPINNKKIFYVKENNEILSFSLFGLYKNKVIYWSNASSDLGISRSSNYFCMCESIKYFISKKIKFIEFGEGFFDYSNKENLNLNHFKKSFDGQQYPLFRGEKVQNKYRYILLNIFRDIKRLIKR